MVEAAIEILRCRPGATIQDGGRHGWLKYGVTPAGPMDWTMHRLATAMAGAPDGAATIEVPIGGLELITSGAPMTLAYAAPGFRVSRNGAPLPALGRVVLVPDDRFALQAGQSGGWAYVAPAARFDLPLVMGSLSTHTRSGLGGYRGRMLQEGDRIPLIGATTLADAFLNGPVEPAPSAPIRVVLGPQADNFSDRGLAVFLSETFTLSMQMDRMAYRLEGPRIEHAKGFNIISDSIVLGSIQVPGDGLPLVLMADRQPTGGYPKIACVIRADLPRLAQSRPGTRLRFQSVAVEEAVAALEQTQKRLAALMDLLARPPPTLDSNTLLAINLIDGVVSGAD